MNEDKSSRYHRLKRRASVASVVWSGALLSGLMLTGISHWLRDGAATLADACGLGSPPFVLVVYLVGLAAMHSTGSSVLAFYSGYWLERRFGLSVQAPRAWCADQIKGAAIGFALGAVAVSLVYWSVQTAPSSWWLLAGVIFAILLISLANLAPVLLVPLFYTIRPLSREGLRRRLLALAERAGARVLGAYEWGLGDKTRKANAALTGLGPTRRILISDTMLADYTDDEIEVVLAHELAHHVHGDVWKGLAFESVLIFAAFRFAAWSLDVLAEPLGFAGASDIAGLPVLLLSLGLVSLALAPAGHAISRAHERRADGFALDLTRNPAAFISAMKRLGAQNLAEEEPSRAVQWLFYSHPPLSDRIATARSARFTGSG